MRAMFTIWYRELLNYSRDKTNIISSVVITLMMLLIFSFALGNFDTSILGIKQVQYLLPGIIATTIFLTSVTSALTVVIDKTEGFMKEFLVSPTKRSSIAAGKIFGSATTAILQGTIILLLSPLFGMNYTFSMIWQLYVGMIAIAITCASLGLLIVAKVKSAISFQMLTQVLMMTMVFLSGAMYQLIYYLTG